VTSWACRVSWRELCPTPKVLSTGNSDDLPPQSLGVCVCCFLLFAGNRHVCGSCQLCGQKKGKKVDYKFVPQKLTRLIIQKTGYEAGTGIVRLLSKASNTGFLRHIKTGCHLPDRISNGPSRLLLQILLGQS